MDEENVQEDMNFEQFKMWRVNALQAFLHIRGKPIEGSIDDLAARYANFHGCLFWILEISPNLHLQRE